MTKLRQRMLQELQLRNFSEETIRNYLSAVQRFAHHYQKSPAQMDAEQVRQYLLYFVY